MNSVEATGAAPETDATGAPLAGRHAVVTGGGRGIGAAIARELARLGARVTVMGRTEATLARQRAEIGTVFGVDSALQVLDVAKEGAVAGAFEAAAEALGAPAILVNNAGIAGSAPLARTGPEMWQSQMAVNAFGAFLCAQQVVPAMRQDGYGRIVNVASTAGLKGYPYTTAYCASKHALIGFTRSLALELIRTGITVNAVCPGFTDTDLVRDSIDNIVQKTGRSPEQARAELEKSNPQGRLIEPAEVAEVVGWLCLPTAASITGQSIVIAGGEVMP